MKTTASTYKGLENHHLLRRAAITIALLTLLSSLFFIAFSAKASTAPNDQTIAGSSFVYTILNLNGDNLIAAYERDPETGTLTFHGSYPTGGHGSGSIIDSQSPVVVALNGAFVIGVNVASNDISVMAVQADGSLQLVGLPVSSRGVEPSSLAVSGDTLYVANKGNGTTPANIAG